VTNITVQYWNIRTLAVTKRITDRYQVGPI